MFWLLFVLCSDEKRKVEILREETTVYGSSLKSLRSSWAAVTGGFPYVLQ